MRIFLKNRCARTLHDKCQFSGIYQGEIVLKHVRGVNATTIYLLLTEMQNDFLADARVMFSPVTHWKQEKRAFISMCYNSHNNREYIQSILYSDDEDNDGMRPHNNHQRIWSDCFFAAICTIHTLARFDGGFSRDANA